MDSIGLNFHLMLENIEGIGWIVAVIENIILRFFYVALVVTSEVSTWS
jgi:hypothetical protein